MRSVNPERAVIQQEEDVLYMEKVRALAEYLEQVSVELQSEGVPVGPDLRVDTSYFIGSPYSPSQVAHDDISVEELERKFHPGVEQAERALLDMRTDGTQLEMLKSAILHKNLKSKFIVCRTSKFDDYVNKVDNIIIDRESGRPICAVDEAGYTDEEKLKEKKRKIEASNFGKRKGASLRYGLALEERDGRKELVKAGIQNIPTFCIALPRNYIRNGIKNFNTNEESSAHEGKLFEYFMATLEEQVQKLELNPDFENQPPQFVSAARSFHMALTSAKKAR